MKREEMDGVVHDSDGVPWDCQWWWEVYPTEDTTRVLLRRLGTDKFTHYIDAPFLAYTFRTHLIDRDFVAVPRGAV